MKLYFTMYVESEIPLLYHPAVLHVLNINISNNFFISLSSENERSRGNVTHAPHITSEF